MSDFKDKKTKKNKSKILEFKTKSLKEQKIETNQDIWNKMDSYAKELVEAFDEKTNRENIDRDHCLYLFHYRLMQKMMIKMSYPAFKYYTRSVSRQLLEHHKEFMNSLDEWISTSDDGQDDFGRRIEANKNKTLN
jgi:arginine/lysine/ornithine decarboxylase